MHADIGEQVEDVRYVPSFGQLNCRFCRVVKWP